MVATDPLWLPGLSYDETELRKFDLALAMSDGTSMGARPGIRPGDPAFTVSLAGTTVNVTAGSASLYRSGQAVYRAQLAATSPGTLAAANATFARLDLVYLRVWDTSVDSSGLKKADTVLLTGTPSASPVAPTPGATEIYIPLATINVPNTGGGGTGAATVLTTVRQVTVAPGGILPVSSTADLALAGTYVGQARFNTVRGMTEYWGGSAWAAPGDFQTYTPTWTASGTAPSLGNGTLTARWSRVGRTITYIGALSAGSTTTGGTGFWAMSLPVAAAANGFTTQGSADYVNISDNEYLGQAAIASGGTTVLFSVKTLTSAASASNVGSTVPVSTTSNSRLYWNITYEAAS